MSGPTIVRGHSRDDGSESLGESGGQVPHLWNIVLNPIEGDVTTDQRRASLLFRISPEALISFDAL